MKQRLRLKLDVELFQLDELQKIEALAKRKRGVIYTWKTDGKDSWLEYGSSRDNAVGLFVLPALLSDAIYVPRAKRCHNHPAATGML